VSLTTHSRQRVKCDFRSRSTACARQSEISRKFPTCVFGTLEKQPQEQPCGCN